MVDTGLTATLVKRAGDWRDVDGAFVCRSHVEMTDSAQPTAELAQMAIYRMIRESVFEPEAIERMTAAYEHALKVLQLTDRTDPITELVARKIIEIAEVGELDPGMPQILLK